MSKPIRLVVVGCGHWGPHHIRTFNGFPECRVTAVVDNDRQRLDRIRTMYPAILCTTDRVRAFERADAVVIATPTVTHFELVREALMKGKHVLCEKPLCETSIQAGELVALAKKKRRVLMVGHVFLFNPGIVKLKELLSAGEVGSLRYVSAVRTNLGPIRNDVNAAYDLAAHDISIFNWLLDSEPEMVTATGGAYLQPGVEDVVFISLRYPDNRIANIHTSWLNPKKVRQITMVGSRKMVTWDDLDLTSPVAIYDRGASATPHSSEYGEFLRISMWDADVRLPKVNLEEPLKVQDRQFLDAIQKGKKGRTRSDGPFALGVVKVLEATSTSLKLGGQPVRVSS